VRTMAETFGVSGSELAAMDVLDPQTSPRTYATTDTRQAVPESTFGALLDPTHSAAFWVGVAAVLGLILVTGQVRVEAALGMRGGKK
jgi:hypothetical protein